MRHKANFKPCLLGNVVCNPHKSDLWMFLWLCTKLHTKFGVKGVDNVCVYACISIKISDRNVDQYLNTMIIFLSSRF